MFWTLLTIIDIILFVVSVLSVLYILFFSIASNWYQQIETGITRKKSRFLIITTTTASDTNVEDTIKSILKQDYETKNFELVVVGDHLTPIQKIKLAQFPITLLCTNLEHGSKSIAQQYAISNIHTMKIFDNVILLDPDEIVAPNFLTEVNKIVQTGLKFFQLHRKPQTIENDAAMLSATMEEINNSIFRKGHVAIGMPSALTGSAMCLDYNWYKNNINKISSADEEKSLEALLLKQNIFVDYIDKICVYNRPVANEKEIIKQRQRWMETKFSSFVNNIRQIFPSFTRINIKIIDKIIVWSMIPRLLLMSLITIMCVLLPFVYFTMSIKWWALFIAITLAFALATPDYLAEDKRWTKSFIHAPRVLFGSVMNIITNNFLIRNTLKLFRRRKQ